MRCVVVCCVASSSTAMDALTCYSCRCGIGWSVYLAKSSDVCTSCCCERQGVCRLG